MRKRFFDTSLITLVLLAVCQIAGSQTIIDKLIAKADSARLAYDFILADELCRQVVEIDSTAVDKIEDLSIMSKNGQKMMQACRCGQKDSPPEGFPSFLPTGGQ